MKADSETQAAVRAVMDRFADAYARRDMDKLLALLAPDPDVTFYGTGADEKRLGRSEFKAQAERDWSQTEAAAFAYEWTSISAAGPVAWAAADMTFGVKGGGQDMTLPARCTMVLEKRAGEWLIAQLHVSFPAAEQAEGQSFPS